MELEEYKELSRKNDYQQFVKKITDTYVEKLTKNSALPMEEWNTPQHKNIDGQIVFDYQVDANYNITYFRTWSTMEESPDGVLKTPRNIVEEWLKIENEYALKWLSKHLITYEDWLEKYKKTDLDIRLERIKESHKKYVAWWLPIDVANGSVLAPMSFHRFCEGLLTYHDDFFWNRWSDGFTKHDVLKVIIKHYTEL